MSAGPAAFLGAGVAALAIAAAPSMNPTADLRRLGKNYARYISSIRSIWPGNQVEDSVQRGQAQFFRFLVTEYHSERGIVIRCTSKDMSAFKLALFNEDGYPIRINSNFRCSNNTTRAQMVRLPFNHMKSESTTGKTSDAVTVARLPESFHCLDDLHMASWKLSPGLYMLAVYGNNWMEPTPFQLQWMVVDPKCGPANAIKKVEKKMQGKRTHLLQIVSKQYQKPKLSSDTAYEYYLKEKERLDQVLMQVENERAECWQLREQWNQAYCMLAEHAAANRHREQSPPPAYSKFEGRLRSYDYEDDYYD